MTKVFDAPAWETSEAEVEKSSAIDLADHLIGVLAASYCLALKTHAVSWNLDGPLSVPFRSMANQQVMQLKRAVDALAERLRSIGAQVPERVGQLVLLSNLEDVELGREPQERLHALARDNERLVYRYRALAVMAETETDLATCNLASAGCSHHEAAAWKLRSLVD